MIIKDTIKSQINQVLKEKYNLKNILFQIEYPPQAELGDYSCNIAMILAKKLNKNPKEVANEILDNLKNLENIFKNIEVVKPGFINFFFSQFVNILARILGFFILQNRMS